MQKSAHLRNLMLLTGWVTGMFAVLHAEPFVAAVVGEDHAVCGPWGCGPPLKSLIVWHGFVAVLTVPPAIRLAGMGGPRIAHFGRPLLVCTVFLVLAYVSVDTFLWWRQAGEFARGYVWQRALFCTIAFPDAPVWPLLLAAVAFRVVSGTSRARTPVERTVIQQAADGSASSQQLTHS